MQKNKLIKAFKMFLSPQSVTAIHIIVYSFITAKYLIAFIFMFYWITTKVS